MQTSFAMNLSACPAEKYMLAGQLCHVKPLEPLVSNSFSKCTHSHLGRRRGILAYWELPD